MPPFRLQYASNLFVDLTLDAFSKLVKPAAPHLALLGNIGRPESPKTYHFLSYCAKNWDSVYWVPGPHELSNTKAGRMTIYEKTNNMSALVKQTKGVTLMDSKEAVFHKHRIVLLGTPLWSKVNLPPKGQPEFETIFTTVDEAGPVPLTHTIRNQLHRDDKLFLTERSLFWQIVHPEVNIVPLTHALPIQSLYVNQNHLSEETWRRLNMDCSQTSMGPPIRAWLGGAAAITKEVKKGFIPEEQVLCGVNGRYEYPFTQAHKNPTYNPECVVEIESKRPHRSSSDYLPNLTLPPLLSSLLQRKPSLAYA